MKSRYKKKSVACFLAFFLGTIGAHLFYLGKHDQGLVYLLFCWTGVPTILGIVEGISFLFKTENELTIH